VPKKSIVMFSVMLPPSWQLRPYSHLRLISCNSYIVKSKTKHKSSCRKINDSTDGRQVRENVLLLSQLRDCKKSTDVGGANSRQLCLERGTGRDSLGAEGRGRWERLTRIKRH